MFFECIEFSIFGVYIPFELLVSAGCIVTYLLSVRYLPLFVGQYRRVLSRVSR